MAPDNAEGSLVVANPLARQADELEPDLQGHRRRSAGPWKILKRPGACVSGEAAPPEADGLVLNAELQRDLPVRPTLGSE